MDRSSTLIDASYPPYAQPQTPNSASTKRTIYIKNLNDKIKKQSIY